MPEKSKEELCKEWIKFNKAETKAKNHRVEVEDELEKIYGTNFEKTSKTFKEEDLGFSVNLKKNVKYNLDQEQWEGIRESIDYKFRPEKIKYEVNVKGFEHLRKSKDEKEMEIYKLVSDCVEIKNNKTTIKVEKLEKK